MVTKETPMKRSTRGGGARPEATRQRLLEAGLRLFGRHGFDGVTTRRLAREAGVNQAAIPYHFGGKAGLYEAVAQDVVEFMQGNLRGVAAAVEPLLEAGNDLRSDAAAALAALYEGFFSSVLARPDYADRSLFISREYQDPGVGFDIIYDGAVVHLHRMFSRIAAAACGIAPESEPAVVRGHALMGLMISFIATRHALFRRLGVTFYTPETIQTVVAVVTEMGLSALHLPTEDEGRCHA